jgi:dienelactone hydrolase
VALAEGVEVSRALRPDFGVDVYYPALSDGSPDPSGAPYEAVIFVQGGFVPEDSYRWLALRLASWGYVVAVPHYALDLAFFGPRRASAAYDLLVELQQESFLRGQIATSRVAIGGHSLGGVMANAAARRDPRLQALFLLGSFPGGRGPISLFQPLLSIAGQDDCKAPPAQVTEGFERYQAPKLLAEIEGLGHFQFTDDDAKDQAECPPAGTIDQGHERISLVLLPFLQKALADDTSFAEQLDEPSAGISLRREGF